MTMAYAKAAKRVAAVALMMTGLGMGAGAQNPASPNDPPLQTQPEVLNLSALAEQGKVLLEKARTGSGSAGVTLANYHGHYTMLTARTKSGGAEQHGKFADFLFVVDGEGTELTGGTIVDRVEKANGEVGGSKLEGATAHVLHKGDVIHIPAGTPHQAIEAPGQTITIYVVKVEEHVAPPPVSTAAVRPAPASGSNPVLP